MGEAVKTAVKAPETKKENQVLQGQKGNFYQPVSSPVKQILFLQRTIGNQAVARLIKSGVLQAAKLRIGAPGDVYEQEADRVADAVMRMPQPQVSNETKVSKIEKEEEEIQAKEAEGKTPEVTQGVENSINTICGGGQPLSESVRAFYEPRFGRDFSDVKVHVDARAAEAAQAVNARAFTVGRDVVFGEGEYASVMGEG